MADKGKKGKKSKELVQSLEEPEIDEPFLPKRRKIQVSLA